MKKTSAKNLAKQLGISPVRAAESLLKAKLLDAVSKTMEEEEITHAQLSNLSGIPRTAITGILSGSLQKVTIDRIVKMLSALGLEIDIRIKKSA